MLIALHNGLRNWHANRSREANIVAELVNLVLIVVRLEQLHGAPLSLEFMPS